MSEIIFEREIARLDGYIFGLSSLNGSTRHFSSRAYIVECRDGTVVNGIKDYFEWNPGLSFSNVQQLERGLKDLELEIRPFLARDLIDLSPAKLEELRHYLSFRVMDFVSDILGGQRNYPVLKLTAESEPSSSECVFFSIEVGARAIILQFNDDRPYLASLKE